METTTLAERYLTFGEESRKLLTPKAVELLIDTFNKVYPGICDFFNNGEIRDVVFEVDPNHGLPGLITVIEWTEIMDDDDVLIERREEILENNKIKFNPNDDIFKKEPMDIDFITHELIHVAQNYGLIKCPNWITEGLADYGRAKFGLYNTGWNIPKFIINRSDKNYELGYTVTAGLFIWIEENINETFCKDLNNTIKSERYL
ncbi:MAG: basic secretory family protein [Oscillospiraceae bacterium]|nr:basic secretory family protein [Oscillospiraceae bacterium]